MLSLLYSTVLLYYICFCFVLSCTLLIGGNKEILLSVFKRFTILVPSLPRFEKKLILLLFLKLVKFSYDSE